MPLALWMFLVAFTLIFVGYPVAFSLGGTALIFAAIGVAQGYFEWSFMHAYPERVFGIMSNYILLAVPFFIFMGTILEKAKMAEDLLTTIGRLFGSVRGGLAIAVVIVGSMLAAATGVVGASVVAMGMISLPVMLRYGYSTPLATGVILASGTLGQIIPPSVVLVVLADQLGVSVGDLFLGSLIPGFSLAFLYGVYVLVFAFFKGDQAPALPEENRRFPPGELLKELVSVMLPPLALIVLVLGSIFWGVATPTEAGALGALGAILLAVFYGRFSWGILRQAADETTKLTSMVVFLLIGSTAFSLVFRGLYGDIWIQEFLTDLPGGAIGLLVVANVMVFVLGFFLDFFEIAFIILPLLVPAARALDINLVWFGVIIAMNLQTSFLTPPFGFALFYLRGVAPETVKTSDIYRGVVPFIGIQVIGLLLVILFPQIVTWFI